MKKIYELESKIRDLINSPRKQYSLLQDLALWNQLCSSLDVIGDTELAIESYFKDAFPKNSGSKYLLIYGILQCLFLQQDAVKHMAEVLGLQFEKDSLLTRIREIRNKSIGHPTKKENGKDISSHFIVRYSINKNGFTLMSVAGNNSQFLDVDISGLISTQKEIHINALEEIIKKLVKEERMHKERFKDEKLIKIFPQTLDYHFQKVSEGIHSHSKRVISKINLGTINSVFVNFKESLNKRGIVPSYDAIAYEIKETEYPLTELNNFFETPENCYLNDKSAYIFNHFLRDKFNLLKELAKELDEKYSTQ